MSGSFRSSPLHDIKLSKQQMPETLMINCIRLVIREKTANAIYLIFESVLESCNVTIIQGVC